MSDSSNELPPLLVRQDAVEVHALLSGADLPRHLPAPSAAGGAVHLSGDRQPEHVGQLFLALLAPGTSFSGRFRGKRVGKGFSLPHPVEPPGQGKPGTQQRRKG